MAVDLARIEIERIINMIRNFDWTLSKQEITETQIILTITKHIKLEAVPKVS